MRLNNLKLKQAYDLDLKIMIAKERIFEAYHKFHGKVYVSFSGGKDSTVLLHLVRSMFPEVPAVFVDTGLEYPEIRDFVKTIPNVIWLKPKMNFKEVIEKYGYPVISKEQSQYIYEAKTTNSQKLLNKRLGSGSGSISKKWRFFLNSDIKISHYCCKYSKKNPLLKYEKSTNRLPFVGIMASESRLRNQSYSKYGCNAFDKKRAMSRPLMPFFDADIWGYINKFNLAYSKIYDMGETRTGCMYCLFGQHRDNFSKFERMKISHPKQYKYCMEKLGLREVIEYIKEGDKMQDLPKKKEVVSPSFLKKYKQCPKSAVFDTFVSSPAADFGTMIHKTLEKVYDPRIEESKRRENKNNFINIMRNALTDGELAHLPFKKYMKKTMDISGYLLEGVFDPPEGFEVFEVESCNTPQEFRDPMPWINKTFFKVPMFNGGKQLRGQIDIIYVNSKTGEIIIRDWKTGSTIVDNFQNNLYILAVIIAHNLYQTADKVSAQYCYVETGKIITVPYHEKELEYTLDEVQELFDSYNRAYQMKLFLPKPSWEACRFCNVKCSEKMGG